MKPSVQIMEPDVGEVFPNKLGGVWVRGPDARVKQYWANHDDAIAYAELLRNKLIEAKSKKEDDNE